MKQLLSEVNPSKIFLDHFPDNRRSWVMNCFSACVQGERCPELIVNGVWAAATAEALLSSAEVRTKYIGLCLAIEDYPEEAAALAEYCYLSPGEKAQLKAEASERHRAEWMRQQPATQKQVAFLRQLGHRGPVADRQAASAEIERRLTGGLDG